ncbi:hypothetical protein NP493_521g01106 [Ridgeia piscesae]|uniref:Glycolipid transfer protein domain-containing protein n=1 Tax=Ridgeia piscesae TaxID=27915 RepID=A0AAD9KX67_RIDPI|nr:hypothetical protein NP493_521g01106 [Ridgeia piscesae]
MNRTRHCTSSVDYGHIHSTDNTRLDLIIPGEAHFYVKAATPHERQQWLVALGSCKACLSEGTTTAQFSSQDEIPVDELKSKKSELRLYCDLLMQQVYSVKSAVQETPVPNIEKLDEATLLLSATCDTFINALEDCVKLANANVSLEGASPSTHSSHNKDSVVPPSPNRRSAGTRSISEQSNGSGQTRRSSLPRIDSAIMDKDYCGDNLPSFLHSMTVSFTDIELRPNSGVPTETFLDACGSILPVFVQFDTLQQIVEFEIKARQCRDSCSATIALLWLKRAIEFCCEFLVEFASTTDDLTVIANTVYSKTLKDFHSYVVRGAFKLALKSMPTRREFLQFIGVSPAHINDMTLEAAILKEIDLYTTAQKDIIAILNAFFTSCGLEFTDKV